MVDEHKKNLVEQVRTNLSTIAALDLNGLIGSDRLGTASFRDGTELFQDCIQLAHQSQSLPFEKLTPTPLGHINGYLLIFA
ncbi:MAG: hypothetical protein HOP29_00660 [Phycisphaerales bacterium]|nr:hypothetical protein [Phycisphaerales bacterium]